MNMSAGAPCSICLMSVLLAAYEIFTVLPVSRCHCAATSSSAFFRLAAANTRTSRPCAADGLAPAAHVRIATAGRASQQRLVIIITSLQVRYIQIYRASIVGFCAGSTPELDKIVAELRSDRGFRSSHGRTGVT